MVYVKISGADVLRRCSYDSSLTVSGHPNKINTIEHINPEQIDSTEGFVQFRPENRILHAKLYIFPTGNVKKQKA